MITFRPAIRENVGLIVGLIGPSGGGKTFSALSLARGLAGDRRFAVIDTEARRALHYADQFSFAHAELKEPFRPEAYLEAIKVAEQEGFPVIVVDSFSHEWSGEGGLLDWQEEELTRMAGSDFGKRESCKMASWIKPKMGHKRLVQRLLQVRAHLILCFRAEEKTVVLDLERPAGKARAEQLLRDGAVKPREVEGKRSLVANAGWQPVCEKNMPYELTASLLLLPDAPGIPKPLKLEAQHRPFFPLDREVSAETGRALAAWASGGKATPAAPSPATPAQTQVQGPAADDRIATFRRRYEQVQTWAGRDDIDLEIDQTFGKGKVPPALAQARLSAGERLKAAGVEK